MADDDREGGGDVDPGRNENTPTQLTTLLRQLRQASAAKLGFPGMEDIDYGPLSEFARYEINNIGDPDVDPIFSHHTKPFERQVLAWFGDLFRAPTQDRWGYVTSGGTECNQYGLRRARRRYPSGVVFFSEASHYSIAKIVEDYRMPAVQLGTDRRGELDYADLARAATRLGGRPAIVVANAGTTTTEALDDVSRIRQVLAAVGVREHYVHVDAALAGVPLALLDDRPAFDFADGAHSIGISTHKFFATREPGGVVLATTASGTPVTGRPVAYTGAPDTTISGSRNGHTVLKLWYCVYVLGVDVLRRRAERARELAEYALRQLAGIGWEAWRAQPQAFTVVLRPPPPEVAARWELSTDARGWSKVVCKPGHTRELIDRFIADLAGRRAAPTVHPRTYGTGISVPSQPIRAIQLQPQTQ